MAAEREKIYECEVKRRRVKLGGGYEPFWKVKTLVEALADADTEFRCKDCGGAVKLLGRNGKAGTVPFVEHKDPSDAAFCSSGLLFRKSTDGREARLSPHPVRLRTGQPGARVESLPPVALPPIADAQMISEGTEN
jgi:hypothetical protein